MMSVNLQIVSHFCVRAWHATLGASVFPAALVRMPF